MWMKAFILAAEMQCTGLGRNMLFPHVDKIIVYVSTVSHITEQ